MKTRSVVQQSLFAVLVVALGVAGCRTIEPEPPPDAPRVGSFTASKSRIAAGETVTLSFTSTGATKAEIFDASGRQVELGGTVDQGTATVAPTATEFYVLRVTGVGGRDTAFVQIAVNEPLRDVFLIPVPAHIKSGDQAQLLWGAAGASSVTLTTGSGSPMTLTGTTGAVTVTPDTTEHYVLTATGAPGTPPLTAITDVLVSPVLADASFVSPNGIGAMKTLTFRWRTAGAAHVVITEQTFGQLADITEPSSVVMGSVDWTVPDKLPGGIDVTDGLPLRFTVKWRTLNATKVSVLSGGLPVWASLAGEQNRVNEGQVSLPAPMMLTDFSFVASNDRGASVERSFQVRPVNLPAIATFTLTPTVTTFGDSATARWTTTDAVRVQLRHESGPVIANVTAPSQVASGNLGLLLGSTTVVVLEAVNAAGDTVTLSRPFTFAGPVTLTPNPVVRTTPVTMAWTLADAGIIDVVGLPTPAGAPIAGSVNFLDLAAMGANATELRVQDPADGAERIPLPAGFGFPLLGRVQKDLWASVNGFVAFAKPAGLSANADLTAAGTTPSMLAPFWDDLTMGANSKILVGSSVSTTNERFVVVQWNKVQIAGDANSELTFQVQLYETGQVTFVYGTMTGTLTSATIGVKDTQWPAAQQYAYNSMSTTPSSGLELNYFTGGPGDGTLTFNAGASQRIVFYGRTATGLMTTGADLRTFAAGDVVVNEAMPVPEASATAGQWLELRNNQPTTIDLGGLWVLSPTSADGGFMIPPGTVVDAGALVVLGDSTDQQQNGGATVNLAWADVPLAVPGSVKVTLTAADGGITTVGAMGWDAGSAVQAQSVRAAPRNVLVASGSTFSCPRALMFGQNGAQGSPGLENELCGYSVASIPGNFVVAPAGSEILTTISADEGYGNLTLPQAFTFFGTAATTGSLSTNGFITLGSSLSSASLSNPTLPSTTTPNGVIGPFWDDLVRGASGTQSMWRLTDRTIISWQGYYVYSVTSAADTNLNFQVHLLDTGVIEFHYDTMSTTLTTQSVLDRVTGNSASVWLERQDGVIAVSPSANQANSVVPNSGIRFTPIP